MRESLHVAFCGGGSGGHLTPAIAISEALGRCVPSLRLSFLTSGRPVDIQILKAWQPGAKTSVTPLPLHSSRRRLRYSLNTAASVWQCVRRFDEDRPDVVVGLGGFASIPGAVAARWRGIPVALLEINCVPGRANRWLRRGARVVFSGWPMLARYRESWAPSVVQTGVPLRDSFFRQRVHGLVRPAEQTLLVLGGSLGAQSLNDLVLRAIVENHCLPAGWRVEHQAGASDVQRLTTAYAENGVPAFVHSFIDDVPAAMRSAGLIVSRAGGVTLAEISAIGRAAVLVPLSESADNHQYENAAFYAGTGAAEVVHVGNTPAVDHFAARLHELCSSKKTRARMEEQAESLVRADAADVIANRLCAL